MKVLFIWPSLDCPPGINHGLTSLSAVLKASGHETSLIHVTDALWPVPTHAELLEEIKRRAPDLVAFSATTQQFPWIAEAAQYLREHLDVPLVVGGVHCTMAPDDVAATGLFDYVCAGEGEDGMAELVRRLAGGERTDDCPNMFVCRDGRVIRNPVGPFPDLTSLPPEDYELFDLRPILAKKDGWLSIITSRGCPFACSYCFNAEIVARYRQDGAIASSREYLRRYPVERIIADITRLGRKYPEIRTLIFDDDLFTLNEGYVRDLCRAYRRAGLRYPFVVNAHVKVFSRAMAEELKDAGCRIVKFGLESGSPRVRREILNRHMSNQSMIDAVVLANELDLHSSAFIMLGLPTETRAEILETFQLCAAAEVGRFRWALFYPYPGTLSHAICEREGLLDPELLARSGNYFEGSCLKFPPEHALFLDKVAKIAPWYVNAMSDFPCAGLYRDRVAEVESLSADAWAERRDAIRGEDRELSDELLRTGVPHYSIRYASVMGVHSDYVLSELAQEQRSA
jgi:radical SAM superfamily enzyme YgiQ (UPF0313 family)